MILHLTQKKKKTKNTAKAQRVPSFQLVTIRESKRINQRVKQENFKLFIKRSIQTQGLLNNSDIRPPQFYYKVRLSA